MRKEQLLQGEGGWKGLRGGVTPQVQRTTAGQGRGCAEHHVRWSPGFAQRGAGDWLEGWEALLPLHWGRKGLLLRR